ncbi:hypothetical protein E2C01_028768 [Portunus trituberculatus]|uniref:RNase H type-1 domain-containing protein n=1 Tax=Portunus trituberculatus TaxID=210409 RepID=A0A5B7EQ39_PORTR|nr:hypothetical protein [Portunus trituberculatus]
MGAPGAQHTDTMVQGQMPNTDKTFLPLINTYQNSLHLQTDGSHLRSVDAAIYILQLPVPGVLPASASILTAELFAIKEGLKFAINYIPPCTATLFTDSLTAL